MHLDAAENAQHLGALGGLFKTPLYLIRDDSGANIGALCINVDCGVYLKLPSVLGSLLNFTTTEIAVTAPPQSSEYREPTLALVTPALPETAKVAVELGKRTM